MTKKTASYQSELFIALLAGLVFSLPVTAKTYKWVDDKGVTHMGDTIPAEYANKDRSELNKSGRTVSTKDVLTPEERSAKEAEEARNKAELDIVRNKKIHDSSLLNTYSNVREIDLARARNVQQIDARAQVANKQLGDANNNLADLKTKTDAYTKAGKPIPTYLKEDLAAAQAVTAKLSKDIAGINAEKAALESRYDADKARYKELTGK
ncbi:MAG: DUF4124 domain-containing protein [Proteobacteria bacterium]|nr:DUF4124 domain-containing protein [Pseudomonadota bacterium]